MNVADLCRKVGNIWIKGICQSEYEDFLAVLLLSVSMTMIHDFLKTTGILLRPFNKIKTIPSRTSMSYSIS